MAAFQTREIWAGRYPGGAEVLIWLNEFEDPFSHVWRIEYGPIGNRVGMTYADEATARAELDRIKDSLGFGWEQRPVAEVQ